MNAAMPSVRLNDAVGQAWWRFAPNDEELQPWTIDHGRWTVSPANDQRSTSNVLLSTVNCLLLSANGHRPSALAPRQPSTVNCFWPNGTNNGAKGWQSRH